MTLSNGEGNGRMAGDFGFMPNNIVGEEDVNPAGASGWPAGARLSSIMCPTIVHTGDGSLIALGSGGSNRIRSALLQVILNLVDRGMSVVQAVTRPRLHYEDRLLSIERPFFELDARWSAGGLWFDDERITPLYELGTKVVEFGQRRRFLRVVGCRTIPLRFLPQS